MRIGDGDQSDELPSTTTAGSAAMSWPPTTPSVGNESPSKPLTTEEICRLPTLTLGGDATEVPPTVPVSQTLDRGMSTLGHGASFNDNSAEAKVVEACEGSTEGFHP